MVGERRNYGQTPREGKLSNERGNVGKDGGPQPTEKRGLKNIDVSNNQKKTGTSQRPGTSG